MVVLSKWVPCKCLLTVSVRTFIRPFPWMYPPMSGKRAWITKWLRLKFRIYIQHVSLQHRCAYLRACFAYVRFLSSVDSRVYSQSRSLDEPLITTGPIANVRSYSGMNTFYDSITMSLHWQGRFMELTMTCQITPASKLFRASWTRVFSHGSIFIWWSAQALASYI